MDIEALHVSQLYESMAMVAVLILFVAEVVACRSELWSHSTSVRCREFEGEQLWVQATEESPADENAPDFEKSAIETIRR